ncbi:hypothetical protein [Streptomyces sp. TE33382]
MFRSARTGSTSTARIDAYDSVKASRFAAAVRDSAHHRALPGPRGGRISTAALRDATHWDDVVTKLGYEYLRRHDLRHRHTGLTWFADAGVHVHVLRRRHRPPPSAASSRT